MALEKAECSLLSWGRYPDAHQESIAMNWPDDPLPILRSEEGAKKILPRGLGRSYGDSCLNDGGILLNTTRLDRMLAFDEETGALRCEAGVTIAEIIKTFAPRGFFPPVVPGTKFVTVAGAIANDIHGKNHHSAGTFGCHVERFALRRSSGETLICSAHDHPELFSATIGGLGLTGLILWADIKLKSIVSLDIDVETIRFDDFDSFCDLASESESTHEYTVAWMDCLPGRTCRGLFMRGDHAASGQDRKLSAKSSAGMSPSQHVDPQSPPVSSAAYGLNRSNGEPQFAVPDFIPEFLLNPWTMRAFNFFYFYRHGSPESHKRIGFDPFFFPLDAVGSWNRLYGRRGFLQHQCVVPLDTNRAAARRILGFVKGCAEGVSCSLAVVKTFGDRLSPGMMSFPKKGITFALDFPADRRETFKLLDRIDAVVRDEGGAIYPAKDARMSPETFRASFPRWEDFSRHIDPAFSSSFWRRVTR